MDTTETKSDVNILENINSDDNNILNKKENKNNSINKQEKNQYHLNNNTNQSEESNHLNCNCRNHNHKHLGNIGENIIFRKKYVFGPKIHIIFLQVIFILKNYIIF